MSIYYSTHRKFGIYLLVLVYLLASLLPVSARPVSAQATGCGGTSSLSANVAAIVVASADEDATIPKETVDLAMHMVNWREKLTDAKKVESLVLGYFLMYANKISFDNGDPFESWQGEYDLRLKLLGNQLAGDDHLEFVLETMLTAALATSEMEPIVPFVWRDLTLNGITSSGLDLAFDIRIGQTAQRFRLTDYLLAASAETIERVYRCAKEIPEVAEAYDKFHRELLNAEIGDSAKEVLAKNPDLSIPTPIRDGIAEDGTVSISLNELKALSQAEFDKIHTTLDDILVTVKDIDERQKVITDYLANQVEKEKAQELAKKKAAEYQLKLDAAKSSIFIISTIAKQIDPKVGKQIETFGGAAITVGDSLNKWLKATSGLKGLDKVASLSTVVLTGNLLGVAMNIVSLFTPSQPPVDKMILEEIGKLREQIDQLRTEMHDRFDRIDQGLNAIYTTMHERFDQIDIQLGKINGNIQQVQQSLIELDLQLSRIERNNFELLNTLGRRPLLEAVNGGLGYAERTGRPMPYQPEFVAFENVLHSWATLHAFDPLNAGPTQRDFRDAKVLDELTAYPLDANINYLNGWLKAKGLPGIADKPLPSPRDWLFAARAYTQLGLENPEHMKEIDPQRQARLNEIGVELERAMANLSTQQTEAGPVGNSLIFSTTVAYYQSKLDTLDSALQSLENAFLSEVRQNLDRNEPFDLYGGLDQSISYLTPEISTMTCGNPGGHGSYPAPANLRSLIPHFDRYNVAEYLRLGALSVCISDLWYDLEEVCTEYDPERPNDPPYCYYTTARHLSYVTVLFDSVPIASLSIDEGVMPIPPSGPPNNVTRNAWLSYKPKFEALTALDAPTPEMTAQRAAVTAKVEKMLGDYQQALFGQVVNEMTQGALRAPATELAGAKALLDAFAALGLPRAVQQDEFLHALLFGDQQLVDDNRIQQSYALRLAQPITGTNLLVNPRLVMQQADERTEAFREIVGDYLAAITAKNYLEAPEYIAGTRRMLDLTMRIVRIELPQEPGEEEAIAGLQASSDSPTLLGNATTFAASVTAGTNVSFAWDFGDDSTATGANPTHTYAQAGTYLVRVTASNSVGQNTKELIVQVHASNPAETPLAGLTATHDGPTVLGKTTSFVASVTAGTNVSFAWDFGNGKVGVGANPTYTYDEAGVYAVRVTASNSISQATAELQVVVEPGGGGQNAQPVFLPLVAR